MLRQNELVEGIVEEIIREGGILDAIPVRTFDSNTLEYNRENVLPSGQFHSIADTWIASEDIDVTNVTVTLAIHGDQKRLEDFVQRTYSSKVDMMATITQQTSKGLKQRIERALVYESSAFSGLHSLVTTNQTLSMGSGATGAAVSASNLNRMVDLVRPKADMLLCPYRLGQRIDQAAQGVNSVALLYTEAGKGKVTLGHMVELWRQQVPIRRSDYMATPDTGALRETIASGTYSAETGGATGSFFAMHFGQPEDGGLFLGIGNELFEHVGPYESETFNGQWFRIRSYLAPGIGSTRTLGRVDGCTDVAMV